MNQQNQTPRSAEMMELLSRDIMSVHWNRSVMHQDGAWHQRVCDVSIIKQHLRFSEKRENHAMYGALLAADAGACWSMPRVAGLPHIVLDACCSM